MIQNSSCGILGTNVFYVKIVSKRKRGFFIANADRSAEQFRKMTETPIPKLILGLAAPTILSMLITSIYNLADTFFVGQISTSASGAVGIVSSLMAIIQALGFMLGHGSGSIISRSLGSQNTDAATRFASTSFFTALVFGGIISGLLPSGRVLHPAHPHPAPGLWAAGC